MNITTVAAGMLLTAGVASYSAITLGNTLNAVNDIKYEPTERVTKETSLKDAIAIVRRNDIRRRELALKLYKTLKEGLEDDESP